MLKNVPGKPLRSKQMASPYNILPERLKFAHMFDAVYEKFPLLG